jgi:hypothetical protein
MVTRQETADEAANALWRSRLRKDEGSQTHHSAHGAIMPDREPVLDPGARLSTPRPATAEHAIQGGSSETSALRHQLPQKRAKPRRPSAGSTVSSCHVSIVRTGDGRVVRVL